MPNMLRFLPLILLREIPVFIRGLVEASNYSPWSNLMAPANAYITFPQWTYNRPQYLPNPLIYAAGPSIIDISAFDDWRYAEIYNFSTPAPTNSSAMVSRVPSNNPPNVLLPVALPGSSEAAEGRTNDTETGGEDSAKTTKCSCWPFCDESGTCPEQPVASFQVSDTPDGRACFAAEGSKSAGSQLGTCVFTDEVRTRCLGEKPGTQCLTFTRCCVQ